MSDVSTTTDPDAATFPVTARFAAGGDRLWQVWADPRQLERWWGPPSHPARVTRHELRRGGRVEYVMTGPDGQRFPGRWDVDDVDPPTSLGFRDSFAQQDGSPDPAQPVMRVRVVLEPHDTGHCGMTVTTSFASAEQLRQSLGSGVEDGLRAAVGQIDGLLADAPS